MSELERAPERRGGGISVRGLSIRVAGKTLLEDASLEFAEGKVGLIVGASGAGKTVLLRTLAGLIDSKAKGGGTEGAFEVAGSILVGGREVLARGGLFSRSRPAPVGLVFQDAALFDEWSAEDNLLFAADHRSGPRPADRKGEAKALLVEFGIPSGVPVHALSGGQRQRLAIARALAYDPPVILYDEPTSGLDPANAVRVAARIESTCRTHGKTSVVVTHDHERLSGIADAVYLLDPETKKLVEISKEELRSLGKNLPGSTSAEEERLPPKPSILRRAAGTALAFLAETGRAAEDAAKSLPRLLPLWRSPRWGLRFFWHYLGLLASPSSWLYFAAGGVIAGFVSTHFVFKFLPHRVYTEPLISDELLNGLGFALYRILVPVLMTVLVAARCGAAVASDVGSRGYSRAIDAMRSMGASPERYLLTSILHAFAVATPILIGIAFLAARATSLVVFVYNHPEHGPHYWDGNFHRDLRIPGDFLYRGTPWLLAKLLVSGVGVGIIAYRMGMRPKYSGVDVSRGITSTIIAATLHVLLVHFAFAFLEF